jgi:hypothetical protein
MKRGARAFSGEAGAGARLAKLADMTLDGFLSRARTVNVLARWPGKSGKGDRFPLTKKTFERSRRIELSEAYADASVVVLVGAAVCRVFDYPELADRPCEMNALGVAYLPHPSGVNRWFNVPANRAKAKQFLKEVLDV